jgi:hypothetical protein
MELHIHRHAPVALFPVTTGREIWWTLERLHTVAKKKKILPMLGIET